MSIFTYIAGSVVIWLIVRNFNQRRTGQAVLRKIPGAAATSFARGNLHQFFSRRDGSAFHESLAISYGSVSTLNGLLGDKILYVFDYKALYSIFVKDQDVYEDQPFLMSIFQAFGESSSRESVGDHDPDKHYKKQRKLLNPLLLSDSYLREVAPILYEVAHNLRNAISQDVKTIGGEVDIMHWMSRVSIELIGRGGLGYSFDNLVSDSPNAFGTAIKSIWPTIASLDVFQSFLPYLNKAESPKLFGRILRKAPLGIVRRLVHIVDTMNQQSREILRAKHTKADTGSGLDGHDAMSMLLKANQNASADDRLLEHELVAQMCSLVVAGTDTTSSMLSQILELLAQHPCVQKRLREELQEAITKTGQEDHDIPYDELIKLPYLESVCKETLRLYPAVTAVIRQTSKDIVMPLSRPLVGNDGIMMSDIPVPKGSNIFVSLTSANRDPYVWGEDAREWKPERWISPLPDVAANAQIPGVYSKLMTYGGGSRSCIGFRVALLEMKVVLAILITSFSFTTSKSKVTWMNAGVRYPIVGENVAATPSLPLVLGVL